MEKRFASSPSNIYSLIAVFIIAAIISCNSKAESNNAIKVFQIGSSRCGTNTLSDFFNANGISSVHWDNGQLAQSMNYNYLNNKPLLSEQYNNYIGYFDMMDISVHPPIYGPQLFFKVLDIQYPGSKFILNTRDRGALLNSISLFKINGMAYIDLCAQNNNLSKPDVLEMWSKILDEHYTAVLEYFKDRPNDLLVFDIEKDSPEKLEDFFKDYFSLDPKLYIHKHKTVY